MAEPAAETNAYWARPAATLIESLATTDKGLSTAEAAQRLLTHGPNALTRKTHLDGLRVLLRQFESPLVLILVAAAGISAFVGDSHEAIIITLIVLGSCLLGFFQEYGASQATERLKERLSRRADILRDGTPKTLSAADVVPGDVVSLSAGSLVPADGVILAARDFNVSEAVLTGETFPVVKSPGISPAEATLSERSNVVFAGTSVRSGTAEVLMVRTGTGTEFAAIAASLERQVPQTEFSLGIRRFGVLMTEIMFVIVILVFFANALFGRPLTDSILFSLALAVGLTPELLPAIISVTLARGARAMAANGVIVRRLEAIENLGSMDILCTDKTGTLTEGVIHMDGALDVGGAPSETVALYARLNAGLQSGMANPLDEAIMAEKGDPSREATYAKLDEIPYDFMRKRLSVLVKGADGQRLLLCKGAVDNVLSVCTTAREGEAALPLDQTRLAAIQDRFRHWGEQGFRVLALASGRPGDGEGRAQAREEELCLEGFLLFLDPPKEGVAGCLKDLARRGIKVKMISGDNRHVAAHLAETIGLSTRSILTGGELLTLSRDALAARAASIDLFVEIDPNQKERIVTALRSRGHVVGYLGDGINDAPALHEADIGISVDKAVDAAREAADIVLLKQDLGVLVRGVDDGRITFANTMKYIAITTSANFGNMISMALASFALPFLPLLAKQILLNNFLSDIPSFAIATDRVDEEDRLKPRHWDIGFVRRFMVTFGLVSSVFDFMTFGFLILMVQASEQHFQTAWFVESLVTELLIVFIIRTRRRFWQSGPSALLASLTLLSAVIAFLLPVMPFAGWFGFVPLPLSVAAGLFVISLLYLLVSELTKYWFFKAEDRRRGRKVRHAPAPAPARQRWNHRAHH